MDLFNNNLDDNEENEKKEFPILKVLIGTVCVVTALIIILVLIIVLSPKRYTDYNVVINDTTDNSINWDPGNTTTVEYKEIKENEIEDEENREFYFGEYCPLKQFYIILGPSYGKESKHGIFQMNKNKDYFEGDEDKMKLAETYLVQKSLDSFKKNGYYYDGIYPLDVSKIVWAVNLKQLNEYFDQFFGIQLSEEAFEEYISKNSQSGYQVDKGFLVFSISSNLTYTYCPVITEKRVDGDVVTLKVDLIDYDKVDSSKIYKFDEFRIVKKGDYSEDAYMATVNISYKMREDGKIELLHCVF